MTPKVQNSHPVQPSQAEFQELLHERLRLPIWFSLATIL
jgi:hypothetical protein